MLTLYSITDVPLVEHVAFDPDVLLALSGRDRIGTLSAAKVLDLEILASLVSLEGPEGDSLGQSLRESLARRIDLWIGAVPPHALDDLQRFYGPALQEAGPPQAVSDFTRVRAHGASEVIPVAISPTRFLTMLCEGGERELGWLRVHLENIDSKSLPSLTFAQLVNAGVPVVARSRAFRLLHSPTFLAYLVIFIYSLLRAIPVVFVPHFQGNVWILWGLDVVTAIPYTWGLLTFVTATTWVKRMVGLIVTIVTFILPYMYFWSVGDHYPFYVNVIVIGMIVGAIGLEVLRWLRDTKVAEAVRRSQ